MSIIALHGFLGQPSDWTDFRIQGLMAPDLFQCELKSHEDAAYQLNQSLKQSGNQPVLMGYSMGGRLALHAIIQEPSLWKAAIIISAHPGLKINEREKRLRADAEWAKRFEREEWSSLLKAWNSRSVFAPSCFQFERKEEDFNRDYLASGLRNCSLGLQQDLRESINELSLPILWIVGEKDKNYCELADVLKFKHPKSMVKTISNAGHRVPWEQPEAFKQTIEQWINSF